MLKGKESNNTAGNIELKKQNYEGVSEEKRANSYWESRLKNESRIKKPQNPKCEFSIVVPVYNEKPERILKQIESLKNQNNIDSSEFEIIYVVNNDLPNTQNKSILTANQEIINMLDKVSDLNIFVIDKSSQGNEIKQCNVGRARNRGVAEASLRFYENGKNGTLIQTDADTYFSDQNYFSKLKEIMDKNPDAIGLAGGLIFEFDPDTENKNEILKLQKKTEKFILKKKWEIITEFLEDPNIISQMYFDLKIFSGAHMISKSYESAVIGGLIDENVGEDPKFGSDLEAYGSGRGQKVIGTRNELLVTTALRESDRTLAGFKKEFDQIELEKPFMVSNPFVSENLPELRSKIKNIFEKSALDKNEIKNLFTNERGILMVSDDSINDLINYVKEYGPEVGEKNGFYKQWFKKNLNFKEGYNTIQQLYDAKYSLIPMDEENYKKLLEKVSLEPKGNELISNLDVITGGFQLQLWGGH